MAVDEAARHELYVQLERVLGTEPTNTIMTLLPQAGWSDVARTGDLALTRAELREEMAELRVELRQEMAQLRREMAELRDELRGEMAELRHELRGEMAELRDELRGEMAEVRLEMAGLRADLADTQRTQTFTLLGAMVTISGVTVAAAGLL